MHQLLKEQDILDYLHEKDVLTKRSVAVKKLGLSFLMSHMSDRFLEGIEPFTSKLFPHDHDLYYATPYSAKENPNEQEVLAIFNTNMTNHRVATITIQINDPYIEPFEELTFTMILKNYTNRKENVLLKKVGEQYFSDFLNLYADFTLRNAIYNI